MRPASRRSGESVRTWVLGLERHRAVDRLRWSAAVRPSDWALEQGVTAADDGSDVADVGFERIAASRAQSALAEVATGRHRRRSLAGDHGRGEHEHR